MHRARHRTKKGTSAKLAEVAIAAPQVVAIRTARMLLAGHNPGAADRAEFSKMGTEKMHAFWESMFAMGAQIARMNVEYAGRAISRSWILWTDPAWFAVFRPTWGAIAALPHRTGLVPLANPGARGRAVSRIFEAGLAPVHKRATANARRLRRSRQRQRRGSTVGSSSAPEQAS